MPNSGLTAIGNSGPSGGCAPHMERYLMAPQPWMSRMLIEVDRKVVEMGQTCSVSSMGPQQKGFFNGSSAMGGQKCQWRSTGNGPQGPGRGCTGPGIWVEVTPGGRRSGWGGWDGWH